MKSDCPVTDTHIDAHTHWLGSRQPAKITRIAAVTGLLKVKPDRGGMRQFHRRTQSRPRSEEHTSELQSLMRISYAVFCLKKKNTIKQITTSTHTKTQHQ